MLYDNEWNSIINENINKYIKKIKNHHSITIYRLYNKNTIEQNICNQIKLKNNLYLSCGDILKNINPLKILLKDNNNNNI